MTAKILSIQTGQTAPTRYDYETSARLSKSLRLASYLRSIGVTVRKARSMTDAQWLLLAQCANCRVPSEQTREVVCGMLRDWALARNRKYKGA